jgi:hypothetical protein
MTIPVAPSNARTLSRRDEIVAALRTGVATGGVVAEETSLRGYEPMA